MSKIKRNRHNLSIGVPFKMMWPNGLVQTVEITKMNGTALYIKGDSRRGWRQINENIDRYLIDRESYL